MNIYFGHNDEVVLAVPCSDSEFEDIENDNSSPGFSVLDVSGQRSWMPTEVFRQTYVAATKEQMYFFTAMLSVIEQHRLVEKDIEDQDVFALL